MADHFLSKSNALPEDFLTVADGPAFEQHGALRAALTAKLGREAAELFAEPFVSRAQDGRLSVAWYCSQPGQDRALADVDPLDRRRIEDRLHVLIPQVESLATDPALAPLVRAALSVSGPGDIRVVGGAPVLVNWGMKSQVPTPPLAAFMRGTPEIPAAEAPPVAQAAPASPLGTAAPAAAGAWAGAAAAAPSQPADTAAARLHPVAWVPLLVLLVLALLTLLWLLWPGTRIFPRGSLGFDNSAVLQAAEADLAGLAARRDTLAAALDGAQCRADGTLLLPGDLTPEGLIAPTPGEGAAAPDAQGALSPEAALPPSPDRVALPDSPDGTETLLTRLESATVLVIAPMADGVSTGSGFVVGPGLIVTNHHVIEGSGPDSELLVTNAALGKAVPARLLKDLGPLETTGADFALLQIEDTSLPALTLAVPEGSIKLSHVVTAGFPGDVMETDSGFNALLAGDLTAIPDLAVMDGSISAEQELMPGRRVLIHSAPLAEGNSGGPLVDFCGRVVGVNTFVRQGPLRVLNFALASSGLAEFLADTPAAVTPETGRCTPELRPEAPPPPAEATADAGTESAAEPSTDAEQGSE